MESLIILTHTFPNYQYCDIKVHALTEWPIWLIRFLGPVLKSHTGITCHTEYLYNNTFVFFHFLLKGEGPRGSMS